MRNWLIGGIAAASALASGAQAQEWIDMGPLIADFYNETMSVPKGWELTYTGRQNGVEVYTFVVRPETVDVDTSWIDADTQLKRVFCGDEELKGWVGAGMKARADKVVMRGGQQVRTTGRSTISCSS